jgi:large subunit ribosomal protein L10e
MLTDRLQQGMRGAWGKPYGSVARVNMLVLFFTSPSSHSSFGPSPLDFVSGASLTSSGQVIMSIRCRDQHRPVIMEALRRARYKFPGRQKIIVSKKWGFTSLDRADYEALRREHKVMPDGAYVQVSHIRGRQAEALPSWQA